METARTLAARCNDLLAVLLEHIHALLRDDCWVCLFVGAVEGCLGLGCVLQAGEAAAQSAFGQGRQLNQLNQR